MTDDRKDSLQAAIRPARVEDAGRIAVLCGQLGYPASREQVLRRLAHILEQEGRHAIYVAEQNGQVVGWIHVYVYLPLMTDPLAAIGGLVVDEERRRRGIGRLLMERAERWAREKGCWAVQLRSNVVREGAHAFYERIGYSNAKTSRTFRKVL